MKSEEAIQALLHKRHRSVPKLGEFVNTISVKAKELQTSLKSRLGEEQWRKGLKAAITQGIHSFGPLDPIVQLMGRKHSPIAELTADFVRRERVQLETALTSQQDHGTTLERAVQRCLSEFDVFSGNNNACISSKNLSTHVRSLQAQLCRGID